MQRSTDIGAKRNPST